MSKIDFTTYFVPFYKTDTGRGTQPFDFPNPFDDGATVIEVRFFVPTGGEPYKLKQYSPDSVRVSFTLEELPT